VPHYILFCIYLLPNDTIHLFVASLNCETVGVISSPSYSDGAIIIHGRQKHNNLTNYISWQVVHMKNNVPISWRSQNIPNRKGSIHIGLFSNICKRYIITTPLIKPKISVTTIPDFPNNVTMKIIPNTCRWFPKRRIIRLNANTSNDVIITTILAAKYSSPKVIQIIN